MQGKTHVLVGMAAGLVLCQPVAAPVGMLLGGLGGLLPDIDHPNSSISRQVPLIRLLTFWIPHRTATHSLWAAALILLPGLLISPILLCLAAGYMLHIAADMMTNSGVPILYPVLSNRFYLLPPGFRILTGGVKELVFRLGVILVVCLMLAQAIPFWWSVLQDPRLLSIALSFPPF